MRTGIATDHDGFGLKEELLPQLRAVEEASPIGWERYAGRDGAVLGMRTFGMSAPMKVVAEHFDFSVASNDLAAELAPIGEGAAMGLFNAAAAAASALGAVTGGAVADRFGYESVNVFAASGAFLSLLCVLPLRNAITGRDTVKSLGHAAE